MNPFLEDYQPLPVRQPEEPSADLNVVITRIDDIEKRVQQCESCLKNISEQLNKMPKDSDARNELKERALTVLEKKKMLEMNREILKFQPTKDQMSLQIAKNVSATNNESGFEEMNIGDVNKTEDSEDNKSDPESLGKPELDTLSILSSVKDEGPRSVRAVSVVLKFFYNKSIAMMKFFCNLIFIIVKFSCDQVIFAIKFWTKLISHFVLVNIMADLLCGLWSFGSDMNRHCIMLDLNLNDVGNGWYFSNNLWKWSTSSESYNRLIVPSLDKLDLTLVRVMNVMILVFRELLARDSFFEAVSNVYNYIMYQQYQDAIPDDD